MDAVERLNQENLEKWVSGKGGWRMGILRMWGVVFPQHGLSMYVVERLNQENLEKGDEGWGF